MAREDEYIDYPHEEVMFRIDGAADQLYAKFWGKDDEAKVSWSSGLYNEMLAFGGREPLDAETYWAGKPKPVRHLRSTSVTKIRLMWPMDQVLYLNTSKQPDTLSTDLGLTIDNKSTTPEMEWTMTLDGPYTTVKIAEPDQRHSALDGLIQPDIEIWWDDYREDMTDDPATYQYEADIVLRCLDHPDVTGGVYITNSLRTLRWDQAGITLTPNPDALESLAGQALARALQTAGTRYTSTAL